MKVLEKTTEEIVLELNLDETRALRAGVGEVCYGFHVPDFDACMESTEREAELLFRKMDRELQFHKKKWLSDEQNKFHQISLTAKEIHLLKTAHEETLRELVEEEYHTRTGVEFTVGQNLLNELVHLT